MFLTLRSAVSKRTLPALKPNRSQNTPFSGRFVHTEETGTSHTTSAYNARRDSWYNPTVLLLGFIPVFTFGLGTWQLQRLQWKIALIDELDEKLRREPILLPKRVNLSVIPDFVFRRVILRGRWDHEHSMLMGPRVRDGTHGYHVITPLIRSDGSTVLVDRGFISNEFASHFDCGEKGEVELIGLIRTSHTRNSFTPDNVPQKGKWHWVDVDAMVEFAGGEEANVQSVYIEQIFEGHSGEALTRLNKGLPLGRSASVDVRNAHLSYVITWYSLSAFTAVMLGRLVLKRRFENRARPLPR